MGDVEVGRRDRKKMATYQSLRSAALRLVGERGLHHVTVEDIAEAADVSVRTFFNHFPSKEDAIVGLAPEHVDELRQALQSRPATESPLEALQVVLGELASVLVEGGDEWALRMEVVRTCPELVPRMFASFATYERTIVEVIAIRTGCDPDRDLYPALVTEAAMGALRAALAHWRRGGGSASATELVRAGFEQLAAGLPAPGFPGRTGEGKSWPVTPVSVEVPAT